MSCIVLWIQTRKLLSWDYRPLSLLGEANIITRLCVTEVRKHLSASQENEESSGEIFWRQTKPKGIQQLVACCATWTFYKWVWINVMVIIKVYFNNTSFNTFVFNICLHSLSPLLLHYVFIACSLKYKMSCICSRTKKRAIQYADVLKHSVFSYPTVS